MPGRVIFYVEEISDPEQLNKYKKAAHPNLLAAGGKVTVAYGRQEVVEGAPLVGVVTVEFPTFEQASEWYHSPEYQAIAALRKHGSRTHAVIVESL
jgi:uncharacterized protein (DUF1330 family)